MTISPAAGRIPGAPPGGMEAPLRGERTSPSLEGPRRRGRNATPLARSARLLAVAALAGAALAGCQPYLQGNGVYAEEPRTGLGPFTGVHVEDGVEATVTAGAAAQTVTVSGDANVVPQIRTDVVTEASRQVLHVWIATAYAGTIPPRAVVQVPTLTYANASGSGRVNGLDVAAPAFNAVASGTSTIALAGPSKTAPAGASLEASLASGAVLDATAYVVSDGASVELRAATARLHSEGPVGGSAKDGSLLDNRQGAGSCASVQRDGTSSVLCN